MTAITQRQREVLDFIENFVSTNRFSPSMQEIADGLNLKSLATVHKHVTNLQERGFIKRGVNKSRSFEVTEPPAMEARFRFEGKDRLWDNVAHCYWIREQA